MTRERFKQLQDSGAIDAWLKGEPWQWRHCTGGWTNAAPKDDPIALMASYECRVKPRPLELWVPEFEDGSHGIPVASNPIESKAYTVVVIGSGTVPKAELKCVRWWHLMRAVEEAK